MHRRISWVKEFYFDRDRLSSQFCFEPIEIPPIREYSISRNTPRIRLVRGENLERSPYGGRPSAGGRNGRVRIPRWEAQREGSDIAHIEHILPIADGTVNICWRRSGSENSTLTRLQPRSRRSATWPAWRIKRVSINNKSSKWSRITTVYTMISEDLANSQKLCREVLWQNWAWTTSTSRLYDIDYRGK